MEALWSKYQLLHHAGRPQQTVQAISEILEIYIFRVKKGVSYLSLGVDAAVGSTLSYHGDRCTAYQGERSLQLSLHGPLFGLALPAVVV